MCVYILWSDWLLTYKVKSIVEKTTKSMLYVGKGQIYVPRAQKPTVVGPCPAWDTRGSMEFDIGTNKVYLLGKFATEGNSKSATCPKRTTNVDVLGICARVQ